MFHLTVPHLWHGKGRSLQQGCSAQWLQPWQEADWRLSLLCHASSAPWLRKMGYKPTALPRRAVKFHSLFLAVPLLSSAVCSSLAEQQVVGIILFKLSFLLALPATWWHLEMHFPMQSFWQTPLLTDWGAPTLHLEMQHWFSADLPESEFKSSEPLLSRSSSSPCLIMSVGKFPALGTTFRLPVCCSDHPKGSGS